jgi:hypothetical protein
MRLGPRVVLCLLALSLVTAVGCRKALTPSIDTNEAPETWITAAPMDTLTARDGYGVPTGPPTMTTIPVRFHLYWAGADKDGSVAGFYYAVVETTATPDATGYIPSLPGPKPGDYRFTTKTDSTFVFTVSELYTDRQHAFYIYAVDDKGKPDATPAKFSFRAIDKYPPTPVIDEAVATGTIVRLSSSGDPIPDTEVRYLTHAYERGVTPADTAAAYGRLDFSWHAEMRDPAMSVGGYRYKLDETQFQSVDSSVRAVSYGTGVASSTVSAGVKVFALRAVDQAGGADETTRHFVMNYSPDTWWAGPDPARFTDTGDNEYDSHSVVVNQWPTKDAGSAFVTTPPLPAGSYFGVDSFAYRPSKRFPPGGRPFNARGTFYEIYKNRLYARSEGDTVHMNSYIVLWNGGYDKDSRYQIRADSTDPALKAQDGSILPGAVLENETENGGRAGSPIGFRSLVVSRLTPSNLKNSPAQTTLYPVYEPASVFRSPVLGGYWRMFQAGKSYAVVRAEDFEGALDKSAGEDPVKIADAVDGGTGTPTQIAQRHKVLTFYVDKAPTLVRDTLFRPTEGQVISTSQWDFYLKGMDLDPFDPTVVGPGGGGPTSTTVTRFRIRLYGKSIYTGADTAWTYVASNGLTYINLGSPVSLSFIPGGTMAKNPFASGPMRVSIQICDCIDCEGSPGQGRCVNGVATYIGEPVSSNNVINVTYVRPALGAVLETSSASAGRPGPAAPGRGE